MSVQGQSWFDVVYMSLFAVSTIIIMISATDVSSMAYLSIVGYSLIFISIMLITVNILNNIRIATGGKMSTFFPAFFYSASPFILNMGIILFLLSLMIVYFNRINQGHLSKDYYGFSQSAIILMLIQMIILYNGMQTKSYQDQKIFPMIYTSSSLLVGVINIYVVVCIQIILKYYTTDG